MFMNQVFGTNRIVLWRKKFCRGGVLSNRRYSQEKYHVWFDLQLSPVRGSLITATRRDFINEDQIDEVWLTGLRQAGYNIGYCIEGFPSIVINLELISTQFLKSHHLEVSNIGKVLVLDFFL